MNNKKIVKDLSPAKLIELAITENKATLCETGAIVSYTGKHTGRAASDKYIVCDMLTSDKIYWSDNNKKISPETFEQIFAIVKEELEKKEKIFEQNCHVGQIEFKTLNVKLYTPNPVHALFASSMFIPGQIEKEEVFTIYHAPELLLDEKKYQLNSSTAIIANFTKKIILICGTLYAGEIKKSIFSVLNFKLVDDKILPMHSGVNANKKSGETSVFFGLSGTGKTTLSTDIECLLIGDDEHGLCDKGIFNFEGGCYAKTYELSKETEPDIFQASNRFGALLENVKLVNNVPDFFDKSITENGRSSYPLKFIENKKEDRSGKIPKNLFFLSADAFGVLPPVSKLSEEEAKKFYLLGYTAKLAGTEVGLKTPKATFSYCFGAPFMLRKPFDYANLLETYLKKYPIDVWLINTGWYGGAYGTGQRFPLQITRRIIRAIQNNELANTKFISEPIFNFLIPTSIDGIEAKILNPKSSWTNGNEYDRSANKLNQLFIDNLKGLNA